MFYQIHRRQKMFVCYFCRPCVLAAGCSTTLTWIRRNNWSQPYLRAEAKDEANLVRTKKLLCLYEKRSKVSRERRLPQQAQIDKVRAIQRRRTAQAISTLIELINFIQPAPWSRLRLLPKRAGEFQR
jgi:hypothetical protein